VACQNHGQRKMIGVANEPKCCNPSNWPGKIGLARSVLSDTLVIDASEASKLSKADGAIADGVSKSAGILGGSFFSNHI
jgi:hypothetical protein